MARTVFFSLLFVLACPVYLQGQSLPLPKPEDLTGSTKSPTSVLVTWKDVSRLERNFEILRKVSTATVWDLVATTDEDVITYYDEQLLPATTYWYKVRAISGNVTGPYAPGESLTDVTQSLVVTTPNETVAPTTPQNLAVEMTQVNTITLNWQPATDASGVKEYIIRYGTSTINTHSTSTTYTIPNLIPNTIYYFTVVAVDVAGNVSQKSNQATAHTYLDGVFYRHRNGTWLTNGAPDIRAVPWPSYATFSPTNVYPQNVRTNIPVNGTSPNWAGTFNNSSGNVLYGTVFIKRSGTLFAHVDPYGKIIRESDGISIGSANLSSVNGSFSFVNAQNGPYTIDYAWSFVPENTGKLDNFTLQPGVPLTQVDQYIIEYDGYLNINTAGVYAFQTVSNDAVLLYLDGALICSDLTGDANNSNIENTSTSSNITLTAGPHRITVRFMEYNQDQKLEVSYRGIAAGLDTGITFTPIPNTALRSYSSPAGSSPPIAPASFTATQAGSTQINLNWTFNGGLRIAVLGSSTAEGSGATIPYSQNGWVGRYRTWLLTQFPNSVVTNYGTGGFRVENVLPTGVSTADPAKNITKAMSIFPDIILVNLPANDVSAFIPNATTMNNYAAIKAVADARGVPMFVTTTQPRNFETLSQRQLLVTQSQSIRTMFGQDHVFEIFDELANQDLTIKAIYNSGDGIHVNDLGHIYIMGVVRDLLQPYLSGFTSFEVHRATSAAGPFTQIATVTTRSFSDTGLKPGTTYYYKIKTSTVYGLSGFSATANATTLPDATAPSQPTGLSVISMFNTALLGWNSSTDNVGVTGYEIYIGGQKVGTSTINSYTATGLQPNTSYSYYVKAVDASNNLSITSSTVTSSTNNPYVYYSKSGGSFNDIGTWGIAPDGSGPGPAAFTGNEHVYNISNRIASSLGDNWSVGGPASKVIVPTNVVFTVDKALTARVELQGNAKIVLEHNTIPEFVSVSPQSTIEYKIATFDIPGGSYGTLLLNAAGVKTFGSGTTTVAGDIRAVSGTTIRGVSGNGSTVVFSGDLIHEGIPGDVSADQSIHFIANKNGTQTITTGGDLSLFGITSGAATNLVVQNTAAPFTIRLGSATGGGLALATGSVLNLGNNNVSLRGAASINSLNQQGKVSVTGGRVDIHSASNNDNHLYFDDINNSVSRFTHDITGSGKTNIHSAMKVTDAIKVMNGEILSNGHITMISNNSGTANIEKIEGTGSITGNVKVQRYLDPKSVMYRYLSVPVQGVTVADWQKHFPITGNFGGYSTGYNMNASMFYYNEPAGGWIAYPPPQTDNSKPMQKGVGYSVYLRNGDQPVTMEVTGVPYQGDHSFSLTADPSASSTDGWNLLGNPYASTISWANDGWVKTGVNNTISVRENPQGIFRYYYYDTETGTGAGSLPSGKIAPGQSFWVQSTSGSPALTITESAKVVSNTTMFRAEVIDHFRITLSQGDRSDPAYILMTDKGTELYDFDIDAPKRLNDHFSLSTSSKNGVALAINNLGNKFCTGETTLNINNIQPGSYKLTFENIGSMTDIFGSIELKDAYKNSVMSISSQSVYDFDVTTDVPSKAAGRFKITLENPCTPTPTNPSEPVVTGFEEQMELTIRVYPQPVSTSDLSIEISTLEEGSVSLDIIDMLGRSHIHREIVVLKNTVQRIDLANTLEGGIYIVRVMQNGKSVMRKVTVLGGQ